MRNLILAAVASLGALSAGGCYTQGDVGATYSTGGGYAYAGTGYYEPQLYYYAPGVSVVAYTDDPIFYSDGLYWRYYGGAWYSSSYYNGGWAASYNVPYGVRGISRPTSYAHFTPGQGWTRVNVNGSTYAGGGVRDHRTYQPTYSAPASGGAVRDHRTYTAPAPTYSPRAAPSGPVVRDHRHH